MAKKMDCKVYKSKRGITLGFKAGTLLFGIGPEITFGGKQSVKWEKTVQGIIARYQELCARFNTGTMTKSEYDERIKEIDTISKEVMDIEDKALNRVKKQSKNAFNELEKETGNGFSGKEFDDKIKEINLKIEDLTSFKKIKDDTHLR